MAKTFQMNYELHEQQCCLHIDCVMRANCVCVRCRRRKNDALNVCHGKWQSQEWTLWQKLNHSKQNGRKKSKCFHSSRQCEMSSSANMDGMIVELSWYVERKLVTHENGKSARVECLGARATQHHKRRSKRARDSVDSRHRALLSV